MDGEITADTLDVSIHATLAGGDVHDLAVVVQTTNVSIHATLAGGDQRVRLCGCGILEFLSTPPSRVATTPRKGSSCGM